MIRKIDKHNDDNTFTHRHINDVKRIQRVLLDNGYDGTLYDCANIWEDYSDMFAAGWIGLPDEDEDDMLWASIESKVESIAK